MGNVRDYTIVTGSYWVFTVTDGALRMLILLYLNEQGYPPLQIALLFLFYEFFGVVTNLLGGWAGARFGLKRTLSWGLTLQVGALGLLALRADALSVPLVMTAQAMSGIAKDLTKMSAKSFIRLVVPEDDRSGLMRWVALLTGSKNTLKGTGFFVGGALLSLVGFRAACAGMALAVGVALAGSSVLLPRGAAPVSGRRPAFTGIFSRDPRINWLSAARFFLFGSRDAWFVLALPIYLATTMRWSYQGVGAFLALWVIGYGIVQALAPAWVGGRGRGTRAQPPTAHRLAVWTTALMVPLAGIIAAFGFHLAIVPTLIAGLALFGLIFATDSAIHSYLIVAYSARDRVALNVGFYYMANAGGRLAGTVLSGYLFQAAGLGGSGLLVTIAAAIVMVLLSRLACVPLARAEAEAQAAPSVSG